MGLLGVIVRVKASVDLWGVRGFIGVRVGLLGYNGDHGS